MQKRKEKNHKGKELNNEEKILQIEKQIAAAVWLQTIGQIAEAILFLKLLHLRGETEGEIKIATGIWVQTIGQIMEAVGVSKEIAALDINNIREAQTMTVIGDFLQAAGAAIEGTGGIEALMEDSDTFIP